jgi:hypothetical protein
MLINITVLPDHLLWGGKCLGWPQSIGHHFQARLKAII